MFKFKLNNFRSYEDQSFNFERINILIGENSGGKSSLIKSLLALKQTIEYPEISNLILNGKYTDLGNFTETIRNHDINQNLKFTFSFKEDLPAYARYFIFEDMDRIKPERRNKVEGYIREALNYETTATFEISKNLDEHKAIKTIFENELLGKLEINFPENENDDDDSQYDLISRVKTCSLMYTSKKRDKTFKFEKIEFHKKGFMSFIEPSSLKRECEETEDESLFYEIALFLINQNLIEFNLKNIKYLNPLSSNPKRIYLNKDAQSEYENSDLEKFTNLVTTNQISTGNLNKFNKILREYGIADGIKVNNSKKLPVSELRVKIKSLTSNIFDVGYGVSLQIPMIFEAFIAEQEGGSTFIIEQPEVHLHPKLQSKFIETLLKLGEKNNYIIETHSEHIVRMLQVIVKKNSFGVSNKATQILYFVRGDKSFEVSEHRLNKEGKMNTQFPSGFYDTSYNLTKELMF
jgi:predicted ATPase